MNEECIAGCYRFKKDEFFYTGHFPDHPITPGVIILEAMIQLGLAAFCIYLGSLEDENPSKYKTIFTDGGIELFEPIFPGEYVTIRAEKIFWRHKKIRSKIEMFLENGLLAATSVASGMAVLK